MMGRSPQGTDVQEAGTVLSTSGCVTRNRAGLSHLGSSLSQALEGKVHVDTVGLRPCEMTRVEHQFVFIARGPET